ncbi:MAG: DUF4351 domain-containing protein [Symploca sp. SIO2C1]|nr:DUF4351 domain-containing protein [Symploca sp. SIO2C1]
MIESLLWHSFHTYSANPTYWLRWWDASGNLLPWADEQIAQSLQQGIEKGKLAIITRLLTKKFGTIEPDVQAKINQLSAVDLDALSEALLDFVDVSALSSWLTQR